MSTRNEESYSDHEIRIQPNIAELPVYEIVLKDILVEELGRRKFFRDEKTLFYDYKRLYFLSKLFLTILMLTRSYN